MNKFVKLLLGMMFVSSCYAGSSDVVGRWTTLDEDGKPRSEVQLYTDDGKLYGKIVRFFPKPGERADAVCRHCKDERKGQPIEGLVIVNGLQLDGDRWADGLVLDPKNGREYKCEIWREGDEVRLKARWGFISKTRIWQKVDGLSET